MVNLYRTMPISWIRNEIQSKGKDRDIDIRCPRYCNPYHSTFPCETFPKYLALSSSAFFLSFSLWLCFLATLTCLKAGKKYGLPVLHHSLWRTWTFPNYQRSAYLLPLFPTRQLHLIYWTNYTSDLSSNGRPTLRRMGEGWNVWNGSWWCSYIWSMMNHDTSFMQKRAGARWISAAGLVPLWSIKTTILSSIPSTRDSEEKLETREFIFYWNS